MRGDHVSFPCKTEFHSIGKENHDSNDDSQFLCHLPTSPCCFFPRALEFSNGLCSIHNNTILIYSSTLKKCFIYVFNLFLLLIHIDILDALYKFLTMTNCTPEYYDFIMGRTKHKEQITEKFMLHATISTIYR